jgi:hypothetical protein
MDRQDQDAPGPQETAMADAEDLVHAEDLAALHSVSQESPDAAAPAMTAPPVAGPNPLSSEAAPIAAPRGKIHRVDPDFG